MKIIRDLRKKHNIKNPVVALGNFDGIHKGHQELIKTTVNIAKKIDGTAMLLTFYPHPLKVISKIQEPFIIQTFKEKMKIVSAMGIDIVACARFTKDFASMNPESFVKDIIYSGLGVKGVCVGHDYTFGEKGRGTIKTLREYSARFNFNLTVIPPFKIDGLVVSSSSIRGFLRNGLIKKANMFLGRGYSISGIIKEGDQRGRKLGFPTANIYPKNEIILRNGVYAAFVYIDGRRYKSAVNVGCNPTFKGTNKHIEAFLIDFNQDIYGKKIEIKFVDFIRDERKFRKMDDLIKQIAQDIKQINSIL